MAAHNFWLFYLRNEMCPWVFTRLECCSFSLFSSPPCSSGHITIFSFSLFNFFLTNPVLFVRPSIFWHFWTLHGGENGWWRVDWSTNERHKNNWVNGNFKTFSDSYFIWFYSSFISTGCVFFFLKKKKIIEKSYLIDCRSHDCNFDHYAKIAAQLSAASGFCATMQDFYFVSSESR